MLYLTFAGNQCLPNPDHVRFVLVRYLDYVSVMTYDYYGSWDNVTGINAPLYGSDSLNDEDGHWKNVVSNREKVS